MGCCPMDTIRKRGSGMPFPEKIEIAGKDCRLTDAPSICPGRGRRTLFWITAYYVDSEGGQRDLSRRYEKRL